MDADALGTELRFVFGGRKDIGFFGIERIDDLHIIKIRIAEIREGILEKISVIGSEEHFSAFSEKTLILAKQWRIGQSFMMLAFPGPWIREIDIDSRELVVLEKRKHSFDRGIEEKEILLAALDGTALLDREVEGVAVDFYSKIAGFRMSGGTRKQETAETESYFQMIEIG
jgi:hypothetical protein